MANVAVSLRWTGEALRFHGGAEGGEWVRIDGAGATGPSPMQALLLALAGCMAADIVEILGKMRVPLQALELRVEGDRAVEPPRRYTRVRLVCEARGVAPADESKLWRAVTLSQEKYCSVMHTLRPDLELGIEVVLG